MPPTPRVRRTRRSDRAQRRGARAARRRSGLRARRLSLPRSASAARRAGSRFRCSSTSASWSTSAPTRRTTPRPASTGPSTAPRRSASTALQYADPDTFVGADPDAGLDSDDEVALIAGDAGDKAGKPRRAAEGRTRASGRPGQGHRPARRPERLPLPVSARSGELDPSAGKDYVALRASGSRAATTSRPTGAPTARTRRRSTIDTDAYEIGFSDRWFYDALAIKAGGASAVDILDGFKFQFGPNTCGRSEATFNDAEGAFVANLDGPVRAIRSYVGANSGPLTERTHVFYPDRHLIVTDLRVHPVAGPLTYHDLSAGRDRDDLPRLGQPGRASPVDGSPDTLANGVAALAPVDRRPGLAVLGRPDRVELRHRAARRAPATGISTTRTPAPSVQQQCWGDDDAYGQGGLRSTYSMPNTDPRSSPTATMQATTTDVVAAPGMTRRPRRATLSRPRSTRRSRRRSASVVTVSRPWRGPGDARLAVARSLAALRRSRRRSRAGGAPARRRRGRRPEHRRRDERRPGRRG